MSYSKRIIEIRFSSATFEEKIRQYCNSKKQGYNLTRRIISENMKAAFEYAKEHQLTAKEVLPFELGELLIGDLEIDYSIYKNKLEFGFIWTKERETKIEKIIEYLKNKDLLI